MNELLVEWTLLRQQDYLKKCLGLDIRRKLFQQYSTDYGRIDFAHEISGGKVAVTELETIVDNRAKLEYCQNQTLEYQKVRFQSDEKPLLIILVADETPQAFKRDLSEFASANHVLLKFYSLAVVRDCYKRLIEDAIKNSGVPLSKPVANNFTHLACLNRFFLPFYEKNIFELKREDFVEYFGLRPGTAPSNFKVHKHMAEHFDLIIDTSESNQLTSFQLTNDYGVRFRDNLNYEFVLRKRFNKSQIKRIDLSIEQKRILIESLMNGNIGDKKGKVNIFYFLRFVHLTEGVWIPRGRDLDMQKVEFANSFLGTNYTQGVLANWLSFVCTHCEELGLVERIKTEASYDRAVLTTLGSRVLGFIEMDLHLKREKVQIPLQIL
jgi:hypothetical protein